MSLMLLVLLWSFTIRSRSTSNDSCVNFEHHCWSLRVLNGSRLFPVDLQCSFLGHLKESLSNIADNDRNIALTFLTFSNVKLFCSLYSSCLRTDPPMDNLLAISFDYHAHTFLLKQRIRSILFNISRAEGETLRYGNFAERKNYALLSACKQLITYWAIASNYNVLALDTDVVMVKNFFRLPLLHNYDMCGQGTRCRSLTSCEVVGGGFVYYKSGMKTQQVLMDSVRVILNGEISHQAAIWHAADGVQNLTVNILPLNQVPYLNEMYGCFGFKDMSSVVAVHFTIHAASSGCGSLPKIARVWGALYQHGWIPWLPSLHGGLRMKGKLHEIVKLGLLNMSVGCHKLANL
mmetsp:Transcript_26876/g.72620  ORF Transcript_26876/g.72620 Transcript_26876/m.72620 type:complete len:348 (-) Transcript_26876:1335-2378(-)|eukprot:1141403-Pelagomonas_calceolata.AAC.3